MKTLSRHLADTFTSQYRTRVEPQADGRLEVHVGYPINGTHATRIVANPDVEIRVMAPHTLVFTGMRWHVRAYCEKNREYRDFVLSRFRGEPDLMDASEHTREQDEAWNTPVTVLIEPDARLSQAQKAIIEVDFGMVDGQLPVETRGALVQYVLQRFGIDPNTVQANAAAQQLQVGNLQALKGWLYS